MFVANEICELPLLTALSGHQERHYSVMEITTRFPWFMVNVLVDAGGERYVRSFCCSWDRELVKLCMPSEGRVVRSVQQIVSADTPSAQWTIREIAKVWRAEYRGDLDVAVLEDTSGSVFSGIFGAAPPGDLKNQTLLFAAVAAQKRPKRRKKLPNPYLYAGKTDPLETVTASVLGEMMGGLDESAVAELESRGELFSMALAEPGDTKAFPAFQGWSCVPTGAIGRILNCLRRHRSDAPLIHFFTHASQKLDMLTPVEVLIGKLITERSVDAGATEILGDGFDRRLAYVVAAAECYAAETAGGSDGD